MPLEPGARLGPYEVIALQGAGGMGEVYRARDTRLNRTVALKIVSPVWSNTEEGRHRFEREARVVSQINHPNVCALYDVGRSGDREFLVMEFVEGETLQARLERGPLPQHEVIRLGQTIASGLDAAHRKGVVHRDLKPGNVVLSKGGLKVLDFGLARTLADEHAGAAETKAFNTGRSGTVLGTLPYMAPEQLQGSRVDARADVFALGAVLYEMATGRRAFDASSQAGIIAAVLDQQPAPASSRTAGLSPLLDRVIAHCLAKDPDARPQTAGEVARALTLVGDAAPAPPASAAAAFGRERFAWMGLVLLAGLAFFLAPRFRSNLPAASQPFMMFDLPLPAGGRLPYIPDVRALLAMSPDGRHIVFPLLTGATSQLWVHSLETKRARVIRGTDGALSAFWSPNGRQIAFFTAGSLKRVAIDGDVVSLICTTKTALATGSWGPDDTIVFTDGSLRRLMRVAAAGGNPEPGRWQTDLPPFWPHLLPDGRHFLVVTPSGIQRGALDGSTLSPVLGVRSAAFYSPSGHLLYVREGSLVAHAFDLVSGRVVGEPRVISDGVQYFAPTGGAAFSSSNTGAVVFRRNEAVPRRLVWIGRDGREGNTVASDAPWSFSPRLSPDGKHLLVSQQSPTSGSTDVSVFDLTTNTPARLTSDASLDNWPAWWPDSRSIVISRDGENHPPLLFRRVLEGAAAPVPLAGIRGTRRVQSEPDVAPNGNVVFVEADDIWLWRTGAPGFEPVVQTQYEDRQPAISADGQWIAYSSTLSGRSEVYVQPFDRPGNSVRISNDGGSMPRWRGDGRELFFLDLERQIMSASLTTDKKVSSIVRVTKGAPIDEGGGFDVARDGSRLVAILSPRGSPAPSLTVVLNWEALLK